MSAKRFSVLLVVQATDEKSPQWLLVEENHTVAVINTDKEGLAQQIADALNAQGPVAESDWVNHDSPDHDWESCSVCVEEAKQRGVLGPDAKPRVG